MCFVGFLTDCKKSRFQRSIIYTLLMILDKPIAIVDIETTGGNNRYNAITEIAIIVTDGERILDEFSTLINPNRRIPNNIQRLTGIDDGMVASAPYFEDVSEKIYNMFEGCYFMAHYAVFDFSFIKRQLKHCGFDFKPRILCSVKMSRKLYPSVKGHSLQSIIERHNIPVNDRHRAYADTKAVYDFMRLSISTLGVETIESALKFQLKYKSLPAHIDQDDLQEIQNEIGVYIFRDEQNIPVYVGKSINLRNRILNHFSQATKFSKELRISSKTHKVEIIKTQSELEALLLESKLVKELLPVYNRKLRKSRKSTLLLHSYNAQGYKTVETYEGNPKDIDDLTKILAVLPNKNAAKNFLLKNRETHGLCSKLLGIEHMKGACFLYQLRKCRGACVGLEPVKIYNLRHDIAFKFTSIKPWPFKSAVALLLGNNRRLIVQDWMPLHIMSDDGNEVISDDRDFSIDTYKIIESFMRRNPSKIVSQ